MLGGNGNVEGGLEAELESILRGQHGKEPLIVQERDFSGRSGSAPPTVEGSLAALRNLLRNSNAGGGGGAYGIVEMSDVNAGLGEDEFRSRPGYRANYCSRESVNPALPQKFLSREDWLRTQRMQVGSGGGGGGSGSDSVGHIGEWRRNKLADGRGCSSLMVPPGFAPRNVEKDAFRMRSVNGSYLSECSSPEFTNRGSDDGARMQASGLGARRKSFADILQVGLDRSPSQCMPRPASYNAFGDIPEASPTPSNGSELCNAVEPSEGLSSRTASPGFLGSLGSPGSHAFASGPSSLLSRSATPDIHLVGLPSCSGFPVVVNGPAEKKVGLGTSMQNGHSSSTTALDELAATLSALRLPENAKLDHDSAMQAKLLAYLDKHPDLVCNMSEIFSKSLQESVANKSMLYSLLYPYADMLEEDGSNQNLNTLEAMSLGEGRLPRKSASSANLQSKVQSFGLGNSDQFQDQKASASSINYISQMPRSYSFNQRFHSAAKNHLDAGISEAGKVWNRYATQMGNDLPSPSMGSYSGTTSAYITQAAANSRIPISKDQVGHSGDMEAIRKAYIKVLLAQQRQLCELSLLGKSGGLDQGHVGNQSYGLDMKALRNSLRSSIESGGFKNEQLFSSNTRNSGGTPSRAWQFNVQKRKMSTLLDEFKTNKARSFELSEIVDHVVEFSMDQYGSRFIQQKLETASGSEKEKIFPEIIPQARTLMTDVFGNYVIQKFLEHGTPTQREELVSQLTGHVLPLSLQMYGCRVIQKALEVVDADKQTHIVAELNGSVMKCVRDQNGNHVIQKCIECIPEDRIQFIISAFYGQVLPLSTHPYGCRVVQRILEHCKDAHIHKVFMDEIMQSVCSLAQDQYGNYVIQHVLEHGKPQEKSAVIRKLAGQIVKMSQQKFASNVVEKCLTHGGPEERQILVNEMLGSTDENEPLQVMMKDPFGNYVVQKVLETCSDQSRELILSRIKVHLSALKKFTYGKHIVSRVEKLITTGERRMGSSS